MATGLDFQPDSNNGLEPTAEQPSHSAVLAQELRAIPEPRPASGPEHRPAEELMKEYAGDITPPAYTGPVPTWDTPAPESPEANNDETEAWYNTPSEVDRFPIQTENTEPTQVASPEPIQNDTPPAESVPASIPVQAQSETAIDDESRQAYEHARRNALGILEGFAHDGRVQVTRTERLAEDLRAGRRDVINRFGPKFILAIQQEPRLREDVVLQKSLAQSMDTLLYSQEIEPPIKSTEDQVKSAQTIKDNISDTNQHITTEVDAGDLTSPKRNAGEVSSNFNGVSRFIAETIGQDEGIRAKYIGSLDGMLRSIDPQASPDKPDTYSESGKILVKMIQLLQSKDGDHEDPTLFQQKWEDARHTMDQNLRQLAVAWADAGGASSEDKRAA